MARVPGAGYGTAEVEEGDDSVLGLRSTRVPAQEAPAQAVQVTKPAPAPEPLSPSFNDDPLPEIPRRPAYDLFGLGGMRETARRNPATLPTSFADSVSTSFDLQFRNQTLWGMKADLEDAYSGLIDEVESATGEKFINPYSAAPRMPSGRIASTREWEQARHDAEDLLFDRIAKLRETNPDLPMETPESIRQKVAAKRQERRTVRAVAEEGESGVGSFVGSSIGTMAAAVTDPPIFASMALGSSAATSILRAALFDAAVGGSSEAVAQLGIQKSRQEFGEKPDYTEAAQNVVFATLGGGILSAGIRGGLKGTRGLVERFKAEVPENIRTTDQADALAYLERQHALEDANPFPDTPAGRAEHMARLSEAETALREGHPVRMAEASKEPLEPVRTAETDIQIAARQAVADALGDDAAGRAARQAIQLGKDMQQAAADRLAAPAPVDRPMTPAARSAPDMPADAGRQSDQFKEMLADTDTLEAQMREKFKATPDRQIELTDDAGNTRTLTARELLEEVDRDKNLAAQIADCVRRAG